MSAEPDLGGVRLRLSRLSTSMDVAEVQAQRLQTTLNSSVHYPEQSDRFESERRGVSLLSLHLPADAHAYSNESLDLL